MRSYVASMNVPIRARVDEGIRFFSSRCSLELGQQVSTILRQSVHSTQKAVPLQPEQVGFCPQVLNVPAYLLSLRSESDT